MVEPQSGIFSEGNAHHHFLEYRVDPDTDLGELRAALRAAHTYADPHADRKGLYLVVGFGPALWRRLQPEQAPEALHDFVPIEASPGAPSTQADVFFWIHGPRRDEVLARGLELGTRMQSVARLVADVPGFVFRDSRDLTGFIDGSANPKDEKRAPAALVPAGSVGEGGAFVMTQRFVHDLQAWSALDQATQEAIIGRTKPDSIELRGEAMPADSHVSRTDVKEDGVALKIYRRSVPYGTVGEHGLYFLCFACELHRIEVLLARMFGQSADGVRDQLMGYTRPVTGSFWFAPSQPDLEAAFG